MSFQTDIHIKGVEIAFFAERCRTKIKFGSQVMDGSTLCTARILVENRRGATAWGCGQILLADFWAFPSPSVEHSVRDQAMRRAAEAVGCALKECEWGHPLDIYLPVEETFGKLAARITREMHLAAPMPELAVIVAGSPLDAALHDAYGKVNRVPVWQTYTDEYMADDLAHYTGDRSYAGVYPGAFFRSQPKTEVPIFHLVGGLDKLRESEVNDEDPQDGLPVSLEAWIRRDGLRHLKIKLRGNDLNADVERTKTVFSLACFPETVVSVDFNEVAGAPAYVADYLDRIERSSADLYRRLLYLEQPVSRDLFKHSYDWRAVGQRKPIVLDEGLQSLGHMREALKQGWSGIALKTCKGQSASVLYHSIAVKEHIFVTHQDLCNPGYAFLQSAAWGGYSDSIQQVEYNSRQFMPNAVPEARLRYSAAFTVTQGNIATGMLTADGLGYDAASSH